MRSLLILFLLFSLLPLPIKEASARKVRSRINRPARTADRTESHTSPRITVPADSLPDDKKIVCSGFDKPASSNSESFFVINNSDISITSIRIDVEYLTMDGRQLHRRSIDINADIPAGQTRAVSMPTWDRQHSFHYFRSKTARNATSVPFDVRINPTRISGTHNYSIPAE